MVRCKRCAENIEHEFTHGASAYWYHGCHCDVCKQAHAIKQRRFVARHRDVVNERSRKHHAANRDAIREQVRKRRAVNGDAIREQARQYYDRNCERIREHDRRYLAANRDAINRRRRERRIENIDRCRKVQRDYHRKNPEAGREQRQRYANRNRDYLRRQHAKTRERQRSIPSARDGLRWTPAELDVICRGDLSLTEMCYRLGRSYPSVANQRRRLRGNGIEVV
jgi:hypothetical protein